MKTTDEMILDLVAAGFVLPEGLRRDGGRFKVAVIETLYHGAQNDYVWYRTLVPRMAYDLYAMECARRVNSGHFRCVGTEGAFIDAMHDGDSAAAIKALWEGVCHG